MGGDPGAPNGPFVRSRSSQPAGNAVEWSVRLGSRGGVFPVFAWRRVEKSHAPWK